MKTFLKWFLASITALAAVGVLLMTVFGLRAELSGSGLIPVFYFGDAESHYDELERQRASLTEATPSGEFQTAVWSGFRGSAGNGHVDEPIRVDWPVDGLAALWSQPIGEGYSTFVVADEIAFTIEQRREQEVVAAYDLRSGTEVWTHAWDAAFREAMGGDGPRAGLSWATRPENGGVLYVLGAAGELRALRAIDGEMLWRRNILEDADATNLPWGMSAAPLVVEPSQEPLHGEMLITLPGGPSGRSVIAHDIDTGEILWTALDDPATYTAPILVDLAGRRQILVVTAQRAVGLSLDGALLWEIPWKAPYDVNAVQPEILDGNRFLLSSAEKSAVFRVERNEDVFEVVEVWNANTLKANFSSLIVTGGHVYGLDHGILVCVDVETGERRWKGGRYGHGQLLLADGHLVVLSEKGKLVLVRATPERHEERAIFQAIKGKTWNHPVIANGVLLVRNHREMAAFEISPL